MELREFLFLPLQGRKFKFTIRARQNGVFAGAGFLGHLVARMDLDVEWLADNGHQLETGTPVLIAGGGAEQVAAAEEMLLAGIGKPSGVATAAAAFVRESAGRARIVCGAWKKVWPEVREQLREAVAVGGAGVRIAQEPFVYLDKNYVRMFGGIGPAVGRARELVPPKLVVVQLRGETQRVGQEAHAAVEAGAGVLMIDTGVVDDLREATEAARQGGWRDRVKIAFAGGVTLDQLPSIIAAGADVIDVGRAVIDAPLLDFRLDVEGV